MTTNLVRNERVKLLATGLNNLGIATIVAGTIGPVIARSYGAPSGSGLLFSALLEVIFLATGATLMLFARIKLADLVE